MMSNAVLSSILFTHTWLHKYLVTEDSAIVYPTPESLTGYSFAIWHNEDEVQTLHCEHDRLIFLLYS